MQSFVPPEGLADNFLRLAAVGGWNEKTLKRAMRESGAGEPVGVYLLTEIIMLRRLFESVENRPRAEKIRDKIIGSVMSHLKSLERDKKAFIALGRRLMRPSRYAEAARLFYAVADELWNTLGIRSADFSFYTRRLSLAAIYGLTFFVWLGSNDPAEVEAFLRRRIDGLLRLFAGAKP